VTTSFFRFLELFQRTVREAELAKGNLWLNNNPPRAVPDVSVIGRFCPLNSASSNSPLERVPTKSEKDVVTQNDVLAAVEKDKDDTALEKISAKSWPEKFPMSQIEMQVKVVSSPRGFAACWITTHNYTRQAHLPRSWPSTAEKDLQVPPDQNLPPIRKPLAASGNKNYEVTNCRPESSLSDSQNRRHWRVW